MRLILIETNSYMTNLLEIKNLNVEFDTDEGRILAVNNLSLSLKDGEVLGIVGESGSGKSVTAKSIMQLNPGNTHYQDGGEIIIDDENALKFNSTKDLKKIRGGKVSMIFQEPMTALNPVFTVGFQVIETLRTHYPDMTKAEAHDRAVEMLTKVKIPDAARRMCQYPHQFSGGMRQRVMIAISYREYSRSRSINVHLSDTARGTPASTSRRNSRSISSEMISG